MRAASGSRFDCPCTSTVPSISSNSHRPSGSPSTAANSGGHTTSRSAGGDRANPDHLLDVRVEGEQRSRLRGRLALTTGEADAITCLLSTEGGGCPDDARVVVGSPGHDSVTRVVEDA